MPPTTRKTHDAKNKSKNIAKHLPNRQYCAAAAVMRTGKTTLANPAPLHRSACLMINQDEIFKPSSKVSLFSPSVPAKSRLFTPIDPQSFASPEVTKRISLGVYPSHRSITSMYDDIIKVMLPEVEPDDASGEPKRNCDISLLLVLSQQAMHNACTSQAFEFANMAYTLAIAHHATRKKLAAALMLYATSKNTEYLMTITSTLLGAFRDRSPEANRLFLDYGWSFSSIVRQYVFAGRGIEAMKYADYACNVMFCDPDAIDSMRVASYAKETNRSVCLLLHDEQARWTAALVYSKTGEQNSIVHYTGDISANLQSISAHISQDVIVVPEISLWQVNLQAALDRSSMTLAPFIGSDSWSESSSRKEQTAQTVEEAIDIIESGFHVCIVDNLGTPINKFVFI